MKHIVQEILNDSAFIEGEGWQKRCFHANEVIFRVGEPTKSLFYIEEGTLRVNVQVELENNKNMQPGICDMKAGVIFGETCFLESGVRNAAVSAVTDGCLVECQCGKTERLSGCPPGQRPCVF